MSTYDWLLFLHLLGAAAAVSALVFLGASLLGGTRSERPSVAAAYLALARPGGIMFDVGGALLLVFGIWLAFDQDYGLFDEWVLGALVLFAAAAYAGTRTRVRCLGARGRAEELARGGDAPSAEVRGLLAEGRTALLYAVALVTVAGMLLLMIFKPGAG